MPRLKRVLGFSFLLGLLVAQSGCDNGPSVGGETHWLKACASDAECGAEASCECGVCTLLCVDDDACAGAGSATSCAPSDSAAAIDACAEAPATVAICLPPCTETADCSTTEGFLCRDGHCAPPVLRWYATCGDPVCMGHTPSGLDECTADVVLGEVCSDEGSSCDPISDCNSLTICATEDPQLGPGGCSISRRRFKEDIDYLDKGDIERLHGELMSVHLATYRYREQSDERSHLGFIIDDIEPSAAADSARDRVDLYAYTSMAVAALQAQNRRIEALERELEALRQALHRRGDSRVSPRRSHR